MNMQDAFRRLLALSASRYIAVSAAALVTDMGVFLTALYGGMDEVLAAVLGYCCGIQLHWLLSTRFVFARGVREKRAARFGQQAMFIASGLLGLMVTGAVVALGREFGIAPELSKLAAVGASFSLIWALRALVIFRPVEANG